MKKLFFALVAALSLGCATTTSTPTVDKYANLTIDNVQKSCQTQQYWQVNAISAAAMVVRYDECLGVTNLVIVLFPEVYESSKLASATVKLVSLNYLTYLNKNDKENQWSMQTLKTTVLGSDAEGDKSHIAFYSLSSSKRNN